MTTLQQEFLSLSLRQLCDLLSVAARGSTRGPTRQHRPSATMRSAFDKFLVVLLPITNAIDCLWSWCGLRAGSSNLGRSPFLIGLLLGEQGGDAFICLAVSLQECNLLIAAHPTWLLMLPAHSLLLRLFYHPFQCIYLEPVMQQRPHAVPNIWL
jgi:hypothetical protein